MTVHIEDICWCHMDAVSHTCQHSIFLYIRRLGSSANCNSQHMHIKVHCMVLERSVSGAVAQRPHVYDRFLFNF